MTQLAVGYREAASGRQQRSDGLLKHLGVMEPGLLRVAGGPGSPLHGKGLELTFDPPGNTGYLYTYDRDVPGFLDLSIQARNIAMYPQGGSFQLPANAIDGSVLKVGSVTSTEIKDGTIQTQDIAANAVQQLLGSYVAAPSWSTTANNWLITPITVSVNVSTTGALLRVEWMVCMAQSLAQGQWLTGMGWDGSVQYGVAYSVSPNAGNPVTVSGIWYLSNLGAGVHTISIFVYNVSGGSTLSIYTGVYSTLYVTEQKR